MRSLLLKLVIGIPVVSLATVAAFAQDREPRTPRFESAECAIEVPANIRFECGNLFVKENRSKRHSGSIKLPVIIVKSTAEKPEPDPVIYTAGGPGGSSLGRARGARNLASITSKRDFIIFEQRGTRYADPAMQCPEVDEARHRAAREDVEADKAVRYELNAVWECRMKLVSEGIDLSAYDSAASAADLEDLRRVLGIEKWNLYGISYSTRLMLNYIREYPKQVRSVVLDSVLPPEVNWDETSVDGVIAALEKLFAACEASERCRANYPDLKERFYAFLKEKNKHPVLVATEVEGKKYSLTLDGNEIFDHAYNLMENTGDLARVPAVLHSIMQGDLTSLESYAKDRLTGGGFIWGMRYSVWCREEMPFQSPRKMRAQTTRHSFIKGFSIQGAFPEICNTWSVPPAEDIENEPVSGETPMLVFGGEFDPDTPPEWGMRVAARFPNSFFYEVKGLSHGVLFWNECAFKRMMAEFFDDPSKNPDDSCLPKEGALEFK